VRIIAGALKGRRLSAPRFEGVRPTSDKLRETLFNVVASRVSGARVLDLFAGTGALGLEALSRGAAHVTFVERDPRAIAVIADNIARCGVGDRAAIVRAAVERAAERVAGDFDLILADPPYDLDDPAALLAAFAPRLARGGLLVLEHARRRSVSGELGGLIRVRTVVSGDSALALFSRAAPPCDNRGT
jgi:16S rRNA (guanine(966)-N(2))-methyltransferase RsmD